MASSITMSPLTVVILLLVSDVNISPVATLEKANSTSFSVAKQQLPIAGVITLQTVTSTSAIGCGNLCTQLDGQSCSGFVYHTLSCDAASNETTAMLRNCELIKFDNLTAVTLGPGDNCRRFYVRSDHLFSGSGQLQLPSIVGNIFGTEPVRGLTAFNGQLFVTSSAKTSNQVSVYNTTTLNLIRNITVVGATGYLQGLAVSSDNYLYIADYTNVRLFKVNLSSSSTVANWTVAGSPRALSLNGLQNILVASDSAKIQEYTSTGSLVREVTTSAETWHAVEVSENVLAVSLYSANQVSLMYVNGTVRYSYGVSGPLYSPRCLGVDKPGYVFVADANNNRVLVLNPTLTAAQPLRVTGNAAVVINSPQALWLDPSISYLYVGEAGSPYRVVVFDVSHVSTLFYTP